MKFKTTLKAEDDRKSLFEGTLVRILLKQYIRLFALDFFDS